MQYSGDIIHFSAAFSMAVTKLLKQLSKNHIEGFSPKLIQTTDYTTASIINNIDFHKVTGINRFKEKEYARGAYLNSFGY